MKLYHYVHCPFCIRVRMALGLLDIEFESIVLPYNEEEKPKSLTGVKMLPIFTFSNGENINESLDIIAKLDKGNILKNENLKTSERDAVEDLLSKLGSDVHSLCMPYWIWTPEFNNESRAYFQTKKEVKRGPFNKLIQNRDQYLKSFENNLESLIPHIDKFYKSESLSIFDIMIASHIWGMYIFPEYQFPKTVHDYLQRVKRECKFDYHIDFWKD
ncbi:glutaredoxin 2 [Halobacteriovorax sp.]|uniref:glutaredoxin 2 n=1 Tax=Halobacteriovorax sp. TaxID=2020862 RepID=UPI003561DD44